MINLLIIFLLTLLLFFAWKLAKNLTIDEFLSNSKSTTSNTIFMSLLASLIGGWMLLGLTQMSYEAGLVGLYIGIAYSIGFILLYKCAGKIKEKMDFFSASTLDEVIYKYYGKRVGIFVIIVNFIFFIAVLCAQFIVLKQILIPLENLINVDLIFWLFAFSVIAYTALTGYKGVLATDKFQLIFIIILVFLLLFSLNDKQLIYQMDIINSSYFMGTSYGVSFILAVLLLFPLTLLVRTDLWQRIGSAKNIETSKKSMLKVIPFLLISYIILVYIGISIQSMGIEVNDGITPLISFINYLLNQNLGSLLNVFLLLVLVGFGAALMSTIDSNLNVVSAAIVKTKKFNNELLAVRLLSVFIGFIGLLVSILITDLVNIIISAGAIILILFPVVLNLILTKKNKATKKESNRALITLIVGYSSFILFIIILGVKIAFIPAFLLALIVWYSCSFLQKKEM